MKNGFKIIWSERAANDLNLTIQYLSDNWSEKEIKRFLNSVNKALSHIQTFPNAFPLSTQKGNIRRYVISKIHTIYYSFNNKTIYLISIYDNRQKEFTQK